MSDANQVKPAVVKVQLPKLKHVPEAAAALEAELTSLLTDLDELEKKLDSALNPVGLNEPPVKPAEDSKRAPLAERLWMSVQTVQTVRNHIQALSLRLEL